MSSSFLAKKSKWVVHEVEEEWNDCRPRYEGPGRVDLTSTPGFDRPTCSLLDMSKLLFLAGLAATATCVLADVVPGEKVIINAPGQPDIDDGISETGEREPFNPKRFRKRKTQCFAWDRSYDPWMENLLDISAMGGSKSGSKADYSVRTWMAWPLVDMVQSNRGIPGESIATLRSLDDYHLLVPDLRGFGWSSHTGDPENSGTIPDNVDDLVCLLQAANVSKAVCVGHDWGAAVCWEAARQRPDLFEAVAGASVPYLPANGPFVPTENLLGYFPKLAYQLYFGKKTKEAYEELEKDIRKTLRSVYRTSGSKPPAKFLTSQDSFLDAYEEAGDKLEERIPFFNKVEEDYLVKVYKVQGFKNSLSFYTHGTKYRSWEFAHNQGNHTIPQPALFINPTEDTVADWAKVSEVVGSAKFVPQLETVSLQTSHWPQLEKPEEFNAALRAWLQKLPPVGSVDYTTPEKENPKRAEGKIVDLDDKIQSRTEATEGRAPPRDVDGRFGWALFWVATTSDEQKPLSLGPALVDDGYIKPEPD
ncbi:alpha/beta hydrolase family domain-containing protein [Rhizoctonia solani AG-1 IA]|uniref:Alpha/beta hydrolase family domain-containing protein n=1 Tax=Thanatephorus cucumeris (strain AG1-IA) TaxID=983506 RepID=L8X1M5_THACA|nr:alpha/beta hydrolase family domain-containing protein [Rhizoctonia solani AG-1 IA]